MLLCSYRLAVFPRVARAKLFAKSHARARHRPCGAGDLCDIFVARDALIFERFIARDALLNPNLRCMDS